MKYIWKFILRDACVHAVPAAVLLSFFALKHPVSVPLTYGLLFLLGGAFFLAVRRAFRRLSLGAFSGAMAFLLSVVGVILLWGILCPAMAMIVYSVGVVFGASSVLAAVLGGVFALAFAFHGIRLMYF